MNFLVRPMLLTDLKPAMDLAKIEGWNQTVKDWMILVDNPLNTCLVAEYTGKIIGTATVINYSNMAGWIGMVLVDKDFRRQGVGRKLVTKILDKVHGFKSVKLDATPAGQPVYQKLGFIEERVLYRMTSTPFKSFDKMRYDPEPEAIQPKDFDEIINFDNDIFGAERTYLLKNSMLNYPAKAFMLKRDGRISGYILGRDGIRYNYIGPVFAFAATDAEALISKALKSLTGKDVALDVLDDKKELIEWLESIGFVIQRQFTRMYLKQNPFPGRIENQYLIIGPEYG